MRRWAGTTYADHYQEIIAFDADGDASPPEAAQRALDDHIGADRSGSMVGLVNAVSARLSADVAGWSYYRIVALASQLNQGDGANA